MSWGEMCVASFWFPLSTSRSCCFPFGLIFVRKMFPLCSSSVYPFFSGAFPFLSWSGVLSVRDSRRRICADWRWLDLFVFDFSLRLPIPRCYAFPGVVLFCLSASRSDTVVTGKVPFLKKSVFFFALRSCDFFLIFNLHCEDRTIKYVKKKYFLILVVTFSHHKNLV